MTPQSIMIFGAGLGTRMRHLTADRPKPLVEVAGRPLIDHALDLTAGMGLTRVVNTHYRADQLAAHVAGKALISHEDVLLETGGGLRHARPLLGTGPVFTLNSDAIWAGPNPLHILQNAWRAGMEGLLLLLPPQAALGHKGHGDFDMDAQGRLRRAPAFVYSGAQIIRPAVLDGIDQDIFSLNLAWDGMIARGTLYGVTYDGQWCDVGQPESIALAEQLLHEASDA